MPCFELYNPYIDWTNQAIMRPSQSLTNNLGVVKSSTKLHHISTISLQRLNKQAKIDEMFIFAMVAMP
jgi:hypothetical protein